MNALKPITDKILGYGGGSRSKTKKTYKYRVVVGRVAISKHYTKLAATKAAKRVRGAKVRAIGKRK